MNAPATPTTGEYLSLCHILILNRLLMKEHIHLLLLLIACFTACHQKQEQTYRLNPQYSGAIIANNNNAVVSTQSGKVAGYIDKEIYIFKGIPYAKAERFMPPQKADAWEDIRSSRAYGPISPQPFRNGWLMDEMAFHSAWDDGFASEDCLRINIWTPRINDNNKRPVMVWLHGGGYTTGSGHELPAYDGASLAAQGNVVIVTINHRLNILGFLDISAYGEKYALSGNAGMLDIVAALQWVKDNITGFGGDPGNVTLFGQSGGGGKVNTLMAMPSAQGLFHKAIIQSGSLMHTMESKYSKRIGVALMEELGLKASEIEKLQTIPYDQLLSAGNEAVEKIRKESLKNGFNIPIFQFSPTVDGHILPSQPFGTKAPEQARDIPVIIGTTLHEFMAGDHDPKLRIASFTDARRELEKTYGSRTDDFIRAFEIAYPDYKAADLFDVDFYFRPFALRQAALKYAQLGAPIYMYLFTWESPVLNYMFRSSHCMELPFIFNNVHLARTQTGGDEEAYRLAAKMSDAWIRFAHTGTPAGENLPEWPVWTPDDGATMIFNNHCEVWHNHDKEVLDLINTLQVEPINSFTKEK